MFQYFYVIVVGRKKENKTKSKGENLGKNSELLF
jgi:hypothetical protein